MLRTVAVIAGATATGKTELAGQLAGAIGGEIVCADARQLFRELETGTGKPSPAERSRLPHHLFELLSLGERASAGGWAREAMRTCEDCFARGRTPVLVGGSGLYLRALIEGLHEEPPRDDRVRARLVAELAHGGTASLHARLAAVDPFTAAQVPPTHAQRICRALEVFEASGRPLSWWHSQAPRAPLPADWRVLELTCGPELLSQRIECRTRAMFGAGLARETAALVGAGLGDALAALRAIGYDEALRLHAGELGQSEAERLTTARTRQLAKRQRTWFRHQLKAARLATDTASPDALLASARAALRL